MASAVPSIAIPGASGPVGVSRDSYYYGFSASSAAGASFRFRAGGAAGTILEEVALAPGESARELYAVPLKATGGVYFELVSGAAPSGSARVA